MTRRNFVSLAAMAPLAAAETKFTGIPPKSAMGIATTSYMTYGHPRDTYEFLEHCHSLGAAGIQAGLSSTDPAYIKKVRSRAEQLGMYIEVMAPFPKSSDTSAFEKTLQVAKDAGATAVRTGTNGGRRYEKWNSISDWRAFVEESVAAMQKIGPIADKARIPVGMENHKDWTVDELLGQMKKYGTEYFGVLLDFGNNISLLDDPMAIMELVPYTKLTHVKDMAVEPFADGFLLSEVPLGDGILDLPKIVDAIRQKNPNTHFTLEMITRDPLEVPCLTDKYWVTFPERNGLYLARTMKLVQKESGRLQALPRYKGLSKDAQPRMEDDNVKLCLNYAREKLNL